MKDKAFYRLYRILFWGVLLVGFLAPLLAVLLNVVTGTHETFVGTEYYLSGLLRSFLLALSSLAICLLVATVLITGFPFWSPTQRMLVFMFFAAQLQIGMIPRLYGYLGSFSSSGLTGFIGGSIFGSQFESPLAFTFIGTCLATNIIYAPFFFLPLLSRLTRVPQETVIGVIDLGGRRHHLVSALLRCELRWSIVRYSTMYFLLVFADFACSDLIGGGKVDAFGKTVYRTLIYFQDYWGASVAAVILGIVVLAAAVFGIRSEGARDEGI